MLGDRVSRPEEEGDSVKTAMPEIPKEHEPPAASLTTAERDRLLNGTSDREGIENSFHRAGVERIKVAAPGEMFYVDPRAAEKLRLR